jgi:ATP-dependent DNA helicase RecQ
VTLTAARPPADTVIEALQRYWGYDSLRPLQREAIDAALEGRDSLVVLPTGGGKSLCYQIPPLVAGRMDVVVSPLISLMKDQVDALNACGYPAAALHSGQDEAQRRRLGAEIAAGQYRLVFVAPERLLTPWFLSLAGRLDVRAFAIDEAHCISQWGHDFRPEYRRLAEVRAHFPAAAFHAFTATATPRVRDDIVKQLGLREPRVLVGRFDRPNLTYRVEQRENLEAQVLDAIARHQGEATIVYCISRKDTEQMASMLKERGIRAAAYHAGMDGPARTSTQEAFAREQIDVVVATVAFGMGIDRSNVRCVIHAALPKSIEHYQQETGRAGRDGEPAECLLLYSPADLRRWQWIFENSGVPMELLKAQMELLQEMRRYCEARSCRHAALSRYFGQDYEGPSCDACDVCNAPAPPLEDATEMARGILGCIEALGVPFGVGYVVDVLTGSRSERIVQRRHDRLPQYGSLKNLRREQLQSTVLELVQQGYLDRTAGDRPVLQLTKTGRDVLANGTAVLLRAATPAPARGDASSSDGALFGRLRELRRAIAAESQVPPYVVFSDATLWELARQRPMTIEAFARVKGVGERKLADFGARFVEAIAAFGAAQPRAAATPRGSTGLMSEAKRRAFSLFDDGASLDEVAQATGRARSTVSSYLEEYIGARRPASVDAWVAPEVYERIEAASAGSDDGFLRPVFEALNGEVPYDDIRVVMRHLGRR